MPTTGILTAAAYALADAARAGLSGARGTRRRRLRDDDEDGHRDDEGAVDDRAPAADDRAAGLLPEGREGAAGGARRGKDARDRNRGARRAREGADRGRATRPQHHLRSP